ncbi:MAG: molybdenum cofactor biosynthesis protein MoaE [Gammaproteobacteria bacterium]|nr:molybdenum cofactor biosynthesis protein MoaE [Gammaproteobacteria bacterium]
MSHVIRVQLEAFDPWREVACAEQLLERGKHGAQVTFVGSLRDFSDGAVVHSMLLEHYPGMTEKYIERICDSAAQRWELQHAVIIHRVGELLPSEPIVLIAVWSAHRAAAFDACRYLINQLKHEAPFWKSESLDHGRRWVMTNSPDTEPASKESS